MNGVQRARPDTGTTEDGRPRQEVTSFARRGSRLTPGQQAAWDAHARRWVLPEEVLRAHPTQPDRWFGRAAPLVVEIGSGTGEALVALAAERPEVNVLALEVWRPGVARSLRRLAEAGVTNARVALLDASWVLDRALGDGQLAELWTFFPDPWPKTRHHKRRLVTPDFAALAAHRLAVGSSWRLATDWDDYAEQMRAVLDAEPLLEGGVVPRWEERPVTKFERRGRAAGRAVVDLRYTRVG